MKPAALSQVIEALGKLILGLSFARFARIRGADLPHTAAAVWGLTVGTGLSVLYLWIDKKQTDRKDARPQTYVTVTSTVRQSDRTVLRRLPKFDFPITASAGIISFTKFIDLALILRRMQKTGMTAAEANALYGCWSTHAVPVFNILPALTTPMSMSVVPTLADALRRVKAVPFHADVSPQSQNKQRQAQIEIRRTAVTAFGLTLILSVPAGLGLCLYAQDILTILFPTQPAAVTTAAPWLSLLGLSVPAACLITVLGAMLQSAGHAACSVWAMGAGLTVKLILTYALLGNESLGLSGVAIGSLCCDTVIVVLDMLFFAAKVPNVMPSPCTLCALYAVPLACSALAFRTAPLLASLVCVDAVSVMASAVKILEVAILYGTEMLCVWVIVLIYRKIKKKDVSGWKVPPERILI